MYDPRTSDTRQEDPRLLRLAADLANVRRNRDDEIARARAEERVAGARRLAEVHDDLVRSLDHNPDHQSPWYRAHRVILDKLGSAMGQAGVVEVGAVGEAFDPNLHEAVATVPGEEGVLVAVPRVGFVLDDGTLVRPAQVVVGVGAD